MRKVFLDPGHGGKDPGAVNGALIEKNITLFIAKQIQELLIHEYSNVAVRMSRTDDETVSLQERTSHANRWNAHLFLSIHLNAGGGHGYEDYIYKHLSQQSKTNQWRKTLHQEIIRRIELKDRGKKYANFHVLRETRMPAILTENGFIDSKIDAKKISRRSWIKKVAHGHVMGLEKVLGLKRKKSKRPYYRIIVGSFKERENAEKRKETLKNHGFDSFIDIYPSSKHTYYRVISGSFHEQAKAEEQVARLKEKGFNSFIVSYQSKPS